MLSRVLLSYQQYKRQVDMGGNAVGLEGAKDLDRLDPFSAFKGFKDAMSNLSAAVLPMESISGGLITLANGINALQRAWRDGDPMAKAGIGAVGIGAAVVAWKTASAIWGLITAGTNLNAAAVSLQAAAASLGGAGVSGGPAAGNGGGLVGWAGARAAALGAGLMAAWGTSVQSLGDTPGETFEDQVENQAKFKAALERILGMHSSPNASKNEDVLAGQRAASGGGNPLQNAVDNATRLGGGPVVTQAQQVGQEVKDALSVTAKPTVDTSDLKAALDLIGQIKNGLNGIGGAMSAAAQRARQQADAEVRRSFSDYGVAP